MKCKPKVTTEGDIQTNFIYNFQVEDYVENIKIGQLYKNVGSMILKKIL